MHVLSVIGSNVIMPMIAHFLPVAGTAIAPVIAGLGLCLGTGLTFIAPPFYRLLDWIDSWLTANNEEMKVMLHKQDIVIADIVNDDEKVINADYESGVSARYEAAKAKGDEYKKSHPEIINPKPEIDHLKEFQKKSLNSSRNSDSDSIPGFTLAPSEESDDSEHEKKSKINWKNFESKSKYDPGHFENNNIRKRKPGKQILPNSDSQSFEEAYKGKSVVENKKHV